MHTAQFPLTSSIEAATVQDCSRRMLRESGPLLACAWPELDDWLDELVPELSDVATQDLKPAWRLTEHERRRLLSPEFDAAYRVTDPTLLARLILAAVRHSELSVVFAPAAVSRGKFANLLRLADRTAFLPVNGEPPLRVDWLLDIGSYDGDDKVVRVFSDNTDRLTQLSDLLDPLNFDRTPPSEGLPL
jgi:hypothetical protein